MVISEHARWGAIDCVLVFTEKTCLRSKGKNGDFHPLYFSIYEWSIIKNTKGRDTAHKV